MDVIAFALTLVALCALCLSTERYASRIYPRQVSIKPSVSRPVGWALLALALLACIMGYGISIGIAHWFGLISLTAGIIVLVSAYVPAFLPGTGAAAGVLLACGLISHCL